MPDTETDPAGPPTSAVAVRLGAFLALLATVAGLGWGAGRVANPPLPVPDLPTPSVLGTGGHAGTGEHAGEGR